MGKEINIRLRLINIKQNKVLLTYNSEEDFYSFIGGKLEFGETIQQGAEREIKEECGKDTSFNFKKILYIRDYVDPPNNHHNVEFFILGSVDKFEELEGKRDPEFNERDWLTWKDLFHLPTNVYPLMLQQKLPEDYKHNFPNQGEYLGNIT